MNDSSSRPSIPPAGEALGSWRNQLVGQTRLGRAFLGRALAVLAVFGLLALYGASYPPAINEAHYLAKARHAWEPDWASGDFFLNTRDAHQVFTLTVGWLAAWLPLPISAWLGRLVGWSILAIGWVCLLEAIVPPSRQFHLHAGGFAVPVRVLVALTSASLLLAGNHFGHKAGEWFVGGIEAKVIAWGLVFVALARFAEGRPTAALAWGGVATAFHVLVGGWVIAIMMPSWLAIVLSGDMNVLRENVSWPRKAMNLTIFGLGLLAGVAPGLALTSGVPADVASQAAEVYTHERLPHHLLIQGMRPNDRIAWSVMTLAWGGGMIALTLWADRSRRALDGALDSTTERGGDAYDFPRSLRRVSVVVAMAVALSLVGLGLEWVSSDWPDRGARWLRYYFHRSGDVLVPVGVAMLAMPFLAATLSDLASRRWRSRTGRTSPETRLSTRLRARDGLAVGLVIVAGTVGAAAIGQQRRIDVTDPRPPAERASVPGGVTGDWRDVCEFLRTSTSSETVALTPWHQSTFLWSAERGEVVNWKNVPQDAESLLEWRTRIRTIFPLEVMRGGLAAHGEPRLIDLARRYHADVIVSDRWLGRRSLDLPRIWPPDDAVFLYADGTPRPPSFEVYVVPRRDGVD